jgi:predicted phage tail protein
LQESIVGHAIFRDNPFAEAGNYTVVEYKENSTVKEIVDFVCLENSWLRNYIVIQIGEDFISKEAWHLVRLKKNAPVKILVVPQGGGGGGGILKVVAMVAIVVAAVYFAPIVAGYIGVTSAAGIAAVGAGLSMIATLAVSALFPPPQIDAPSTQSSTSITENQTFGFSSTKNTTKPYSTVARVYGRNKVTPAYAAKPFIQSSGDKQWLYLLFDFGYGPLNLTDLKIGQNGIDTYEDVEYLVHPSFLAGDELTYYNKDVEQDSYSLKLALGSYREVTSTEDCKQVVLDFQFPSGLNKINQSNGNYENYTVEFSVEARVVGSSTWLSYQSFSYALDGAYASVSGSNLISCTAATGRPFFVSLTFNFSTSEQYEFRTTRTTEDSIDRYISDDVYLAALRSIKDVAPIAPLVPHTIVEMKILATEQLSGVVDEFSAIATSILPVWNGNSWENQETRSPAWIYADILRGTASSKPIADSRIDLVSLLEWANWCAAPALNEPTKPKAQCDLIVNGSSTAWQALKLVSGTGDATPTVKSGKYSISIDREKSIPVQLFTPRNCLSFTALRSFHEQPHALRVQFVDPEEEWLPREIVVYDDGYNETNATKFEVLELTGITNYHQAWRLGRRALAQGRLRQETYTITVGVENLLASRGDLVRLAYDVPKIGDGWGRIESFIGSRVTLDTPFKIIGIGYYLKTRVNSTLQLDYLIVDVIDEYTVIVSGDINKLAVGQLCAYGELGQVTLDCLVKTVVPMADLKAGIDLVAYAPEIYTAEVDEIPPYTPLISNNDDLRPGPVGNLQASQYTTVINRYPYIAIALSWIGSPPGAVPTGYEVYEKQNGAWVVIGSTSDRTFYAYKNVRLVDESGNIVDLVGKTLEFAVVGVGTTGQRINPEEATQVSIIPLGDTSPPDAPTYLDLDVRNSNQITLEWGHPENNDIDYYEVRYSPEFSLTSSYEESTVAVERVAFPANTVSLQARFGTYLVKTIDTSGNISVGSVLAITPTKTLFDYELIETVNSDTWTGDKEYLEVYDTDKIRTITTGVPGEYKPDGTYYYPDLVDLGDIYPIRITSLIIAHGFTATEAVSTNTNWDAWLEVRTGTEITRLSDWGTLDTVNPIGYGPNDFGDWRTFKAGDFTAYLIQFRLRTHSDFENLGVAVESAQITLHSQSRTEGEYDVTCAIGGSRVNYAEEFQFRPAIAITQDDVQAGDRYTLSNQDTAGFDIEFFDSSGTSVSRQFDWVSRGIGRKVVSIPT